MNGRPHQASLKKISSDALSKILSKINPRLNDSIGRMEKDQHAYLARYPYGSFIFP